MSQDFDWNSGDPDILFPTIQGIAICYEENGDIAIRQRGQANNDQIVVIPRIYLKTFIEAITPF
jgi:hypothetical protein